MRLRNILFGIGLVFAPACVFDESGTPMPGGTADVDASVPTPEATVDAAPPIPPDAQPPAPPDARDGDGPGPGGGPGHH